MAKMKLTKIHSSHDSLSRGSYTGWANSLPCVGEHFYLNYEDPDYEGRIKTLSTTKIQSVIDLGNGNWSFSTRNSEYTLETVKSHD